MTPKEKAIELYNRYMHMPYPTHSDMAKENVLMLIAQILHVCEFHRLSAEKEWWLDVKKEIEFL